MSEMNTLGWTFNTEAEKYAKIRPGYVEEF